MSRYPEIRAGQRITGEMLTGIQFEEVVKQAATIRASDPNVDPDPDLQFTLEANASYHVEFFIQYLTNSTANFKTSWTVPTGASGLRRCLGLKLGVDEQGDMRSSVHGFGTLVTYGYRSSNSQVFLTESGIVTTSAGGTLALNWAQNATAAYDTEVSAFSYARLKRVA